MRIQIIGRTYALLKYRMRVIRTRGLYTFYPSFEIHLRAVTFGLMYFSIQ